MFLRLCPGKTYLVPSLFLLCSLPTHCEVSGLVQFILLSPGQLTLPQAQSCRTQLLWTGTFETVSLNQSFCLQTFSCTFCNYENSDNVEGKEWGQSPGCNLNLRCHTLGPEFVPSYRCLSSQSLWSTNEKASIEHLVPGCLTLVLSMSVPSVPREGTWE